MGMGIGIATLFETEKDAAFNQKVKPPEYSMQQQPLSLTFSQLTWPIMADLEQEVPAVFAEIGRLVICHRFTAHFTAHRFTLHCFCHGHLLWCEAWP